ncbi:N-acetylmuramoyl-L-alanine amidase [Anaerocolumna sp. MB42-C2]|uniref:N-acetylmuramoyl-L-alanine amidase n=1 Tax=Anaerocolumna sp. MB42-C2 TaxID=3070997 RepID=UPI0027DF25B4|nr:N-acetylmuramoyl-L-alanine amidase [Anaerocolumna sp. MB42-C2]WMJ88768.1 N-acetylmuramoyl-L-alanine amidase [Anaerocolumna sp. MB42-C2]
MAYRIAIDAGHGGYDNGAMYRERLEKDDNLNLALAVGEILAYSGMDVIFTRIDDSYISPLERAYMANEENADLFVSIHRNSSPTLNTYSGVQTLIYEEDGLNQHIAKAINQELEEVGFTDLGVDVRTELAVLRRTKMPALLVEVGFINSDSDNELFDDQFNEIAYAIASGILEGLGEEAEEGQLYRVQVGLFRILSNAQNLQNNLIDAGYDVLLVSQGDYYAVQVGELQTMDDAQNWNRN